MSPDQLHKHQQSELRRAEVKQEKESRYARFRAKPTAYKYNPKPNRQTLADADLIDSGKIPKPTDIHKHGNFTEYIWQWQGAHSLQTAQNFLLLSKTALPPDSMGYLAMGTGHGKHSHWIGTRFGNPRDIWRHSQTFLTSKSGNTQEINQNLQYSTDAVTVFTEVKLTTQGRVIAHGHRRQASKKNSRE